MGSERCFRSSSSSLASSSSSSLPSPECAVPMAGDRMVKVEMEAAEALAELAQLGVRDASGDGRGKWGTKGKRARKQVKSESPTNESRLNTLELLPMRSDLAQDSAAVAQQQSEKPDRDVKIDPLNADQDLFMKLKAEKDTHLAVPTGVWSRQNLTEAEKEARRIRRILANRESARQTIRRRQALYEELTQKAAELSLENEKLKREKEKAVKEYESLKLTNKLLKAQTAKAIKHEVEEISGESKPSNVHTTPKPASYPLLMYNHYPPFAHPYWPSTAQPPEQDPVSNVNGHRPPYYVVPCSWFFPVFEQGSQLPSPCLKVAPEESRFYPASGCNSKSVSQENDMSSLAMKLDMRRENKHLFQSSSPKKTYQECSEDQPFCEKKVEAVVAAAEARKRRKELTKLKNLHGRQCRS